MELLSTWRSESLYKLRYCPVTPIQTAFSAGTVPSYIASSGTYYPIFRLLYRLPPLQNDPQPQPNNEWPTQPNDEECNED